MRMLCFVHYEQTKRLIDWSIFACLLDWLIDWLVDRLTDWLSDLIDWLIGCLTTEGLPDWLINWFIHTFIDRSIDWTLLILLQLHRAMKAQRMLRDNETGETGKTTDPAGCATNALPNCNMSDLYRLRDFYAALIKHGINIKQKIDGTLCSYRTRCGIHTCIPTPVTRLGLSQ